LEEKRSITIGYRKKNGKNDRSQLAIAIDVIVLIFFEARIDA